VSKRLRQYVEALAERHVLVGFCILVAHVSMSASPGFRFVFVLAPWQCWATTFVAVGLLAFVAKYRHSEQLTRLLGIASMILGAVWAVNFALSYAVDHNRVSPLGAVLFAYLARKDFIILGLPDSPAWEARIDQRIAEHPSVQ
jgi:FtsH-binding integral membrane protein